MKPRYMLDTDTIIFLQRGKSAAAEKRFRQVRMDAQGVSEAAISVITYGELLCGLDGVRQPGRDILRAILSAVPALLLKKEAGELWAEVGTTLKKQGRSIGNNDLWIAAHALSEDLVLVTNNESEFRRVPGLRIENWTK